MPIGQSLLVFQASVAQCDSLIANAHSVAVGGKFYFSIRDREQITVAAFLNLFIAWEEFVEASIGDFMMGEPTIGGKHPVRYVNPPTRDHSGRMVVHMNRFFDYASHENVKKLARLYFDTGYPYDTPINSLSQELSDLKIMRNACAHMSSTTKAALEGLCLRVFGSPQAGITVYQMLTANDPRSNPTATVYASYRDKLLLAAALIAQG
jgi:hypothetical protein